MGLFQGCPGWRSTYVAQGIPARRPLPFRCWYIPKYPPKYPHVLGHDLNNISYNYLHVPRCEQVVSRSAPPAFARQDGLSVAIKAIGVASTNPAVPRVMLSTEVLKSTTWRCLEHFGTSYDGHHWKFLESAAIKYHGAVFGVNLGVPELSFIMSTTGRTQEGNTHCVCESQIFRPFHQRRLTPLQPSIARLGMPMETSLGMLVLLQRMLPPHLPDPDRVRCGT